VKHQCDSSEIDSADDWRTSGR